MAKVVATLQAILSLNDSQFTTGMNNAKSSMQDASGRAKAMGSSMKSIGGEIAMVSAPIAAAFGVAVNQSMKFDEAMTNTGAVLGLSRQQMAGMKTEILALGGASREGPQAVADAMYDIAGGVADASTHMAILNAAISTSQAGNASLAGTTKALISTMNSYNFTADKAAKVSDVLTQTVGKGVGTMDEFAAALPNVTGLAASLSIPLEDVGSMMAFLTTKGNSAAESATMLGANMSALMKPNADMKAALQELGFASGEAAIKQLGLVGALQAISGTTTAGTNGMAALLGSQEAVRGSVALLGEGFKGFDQTFKTSIDGVTSRTEAIQMSSPAAQFDLLKSSISETAIKAGDALVPALVSIWEKAQPIITSVGEWISKNPELTSQLGLLAIGGVVVGGALSALGTVIAVGGTLLSGVGALIAFLSGPVGLVVLISGLVAAFALGYPGGLPKLLSDAANSFKQIVSIISYAFLNWVRDLAQSFHDLAVQLGLATDASGKWKEGGATFSGGGQQGGGSSGGGSVGFGGGKAVGGAVTSGMSYLVGEQGPELFTPSSSGNISTASETAGMMGGWTINGGIHIHANSEAEGQAGMRGALAAARARGY